MRLARIVIFPLFLVLASVVYAEEPHLTVETAGETTNLTIELLDELPQTSFTSTTIWTDGKIEFSGVPLSTLVDGIQSESTIIRLVALNDYAVDIPLSEISDDYPIVATRMNGEFMKVRDKGPFWIVYPYDEGPQYQTDLVYSRSIWQLKTVSVID